ncbi:hypothetical protein [Alkalicoccus urumqiensis]|uniref:Uncharacterized protein n=1 Tax=Alkalicoccus urumqiensis TaxID=1548213 RepID=A0A2P6MIW8_ALKUR|nr:hypothetical protein [Alkalicoccus urumqiensis]PRO66244.1 hypothetical protein C6I21_05430 [Alkalicoccus urumqiensis]
MKMIYSFEDGTKFVSRFDVEQEVTGDERIIEALREARKNNHRLTLHTSDGEVQGKRFEEVTSLEIKWNEN